MSEDSVPWETQAVIAHLRTELVECRALYVRSRELHDCDGRALIKKFAEAAELQKENARLIDVVASLSAEVADLRLRLENGRPPCS